MITRRSFLSSLVGLLATPLVAAAASPAVVEMFGPVCLPAKVKISQPHTQTYSQNYAMVYNVEGDWYPSDAKIARHIASVHGINPSGMSRSQMLIAHDQAHGVRVRAVAAAPVRVRYRAIAPSYSNCPKGRCPIN